MAKCYGCLRCWELKNKIKFNVPENVNDIILSFLTCHDIDEHIDDNYLFISLNPCDAIPIKHLKYVVHGNHKHYEVLKKYINTDTMFNIRTFYSQLWDVHYLIRWINSCFVKNGNFFIYRNKLYNEVEIILDIVEIMIDYCFDIVPQLNKYFKSKEYLLKTHLKYNLNEIRYGKFLL